MFMSVTRYVVSGRAMTFGFEIRWQNLRHEPVKISLLSQLSESGISCRTGFSRFGSLDDTATIPPNA